MVTRNDITGDLLKSKLNNEKFEENFEKIFGQKKKTNGGWKPPTAVEHSEDWQSEQRDRAISQNGNIGYTPEQIEGEEDVE